MAKANRLTDSVVNSLKHDEPDSAGKIKEIWRNDGNGLYIRVRPNGNKAWVLRRKIKKVTQKTTIGHYPAMSLRDARLAAAQLRIGDKEKSKRSSTGVNTPGTFGEMLLQYYSEQIEHNYKRPQQVRMYIDNRVPDTIKLLKITDLDSNETREFRIVVRDWLFQYARSSGPVGANRLLAILKQATKYGTAIGYLTIDPLRELTRKLVGGTEKSGDRTLTDKEIKRLWFAESEHIPLLKFLLLTGQRIGEAQQACWSDIHDGRWYITAEISKNNKAHWVPITDAISEVLKPLSRTRTKIFGTRSTTGTQSWLKRWCIREGIDPRFTPHDLRRTFVTEINELGVEPYVIERLVNHSMSGVMAVYNKAEYAEERIAAAQLWGDHVSRIIGNSA